MKEYYDYQRIKDLYEELVSKMKEDNKMTNTQAWDYAVGMIKVDGLEPTQEFKEYIEKEKRGEVTMTDIKQYLDKKYKVKEEKVNG